MQSDANYNYTYDPEGNLSTRTSKTDGSVAHYFWDNRDRLTEVKFEDNSGHVTSDVQYTYDVENRWIGETVTNYNSDGSTDITQTQFVYDGNQIVLQFNKATHVDVGNPVPTLGDLGNADLSERYLWGPAVDQLLAQETPVAVDGLLQAGTVDWALTDNLGSVRDLAVYDDATGTSIATHRVFTSFGQQVSQVDPSTGLPTSAVDCLFGFTGRPFDNATQLQNNDNRWYEPITHRWLSQDPSGLGPDSNPYRYCGNGPTDGTDPEGLEVRCAACHNSVILMGGSIRDLPQSYQVSAMQWLQTCDPGQVDNYNAGLRQQYQDVHSGALGPVTAFTGMVGRNVVSPVVQGIGGLFGLSPEDSQKVATVVGGALEAASGVALLVPSFGASAYLIADGASLAAGTVDKKYDLVGRAWQQAGKLTTGSATDGATVRMLIPMVAAAGTPSGVTVPKVGFRSVSAMPIPIGNVAALKTGLATELAVEWTTASTVVVKGSLGTVTVLQMSAKGTPGPSGRQSTEKYLENNWDKGTFGNVSKSIEYHVGKHGKGLSPVEYTQRALKAFDNALAKKTKTTDLQGRAAVRVDAPEGSGLFTPHGKIIWFHPE